MARNWWNIKNTPYSPVAQGANFWITAMDPAGTGILPANSSGLAAWVDKTGVSGNVDQATGGNQPTFLLNQLNGNPGIYFPGAPSTVFMQAAAYSAERNTAAFTIYIVCKPMGNDTLFRSPMTSRRFSSPNWTGYWFYADSTNVLTFTHGDNTATPIAIGSVTATNGTARILTATCVTGSQTFRVGSTVASGSANFTPQTTQALRIGAGATEGGVNFYWCGMIFEIIYFPTIRTAIQQRDDRNYLQGNWGNI